MGRNPKAATLHRRGKKRSLLRCWTISPTGQYEGLVGGSSVPSTLGGLPSRLLFSHTIGKSYLHHRPATAPCGVLPRLWPMARLVIGRPYPSGAPNEKPSPTPHQQNHQTVPDYVTLPAQVAAGRGGPMNGNPLQHRLPLSSHEHHHPAPNSFSPFTASNCGRQRHGIAALPPAPPQGVSFFAPRCTCLARRILPPKAATVAEFPNKAGRRVTLARPPLREQRRRSPGPPIRSPRADGL